MKYKKPEAQDAVYDVQADVQALARACQESQYALAYQYATALAQWAKEQARLEYETVFGEGGR